MNIQSVETHYSFLRDKKKEINKNIKLLFFFVNVDQDGGNWVRVSHSEVGKEKKQTTSLIGDAGFALFYLATFFEEKKKKKTHTHNVLQKKWRIIAIPRNLQTPATTISFKAVLTYYKTTKSTKSASHRVQIFGVFCHIKRGWREKS